MEMKIGARIAKLRRERGMTQDQLAEKLGVSAPAVSKWETDNSYPDITLLCPLARALDTNVDTLLQFEESLTEKEAEEKMNAVLETARRDGTQAGEKMILELLHKYPNSAALKFYAAAAWNVFRVFFPSADEETVQRWEEMKKKLLMELRLSASAEYWQSATMQLASIAINEDQLEQASSLLKELPEHTIDTTLVWSTLYLKKEEPREALKMVQKRLFYFVRQTQTCLSVMMNPKIVPDYEQELEICEVYKVVSELFGCGGGMHDGLFLEIYLRMGRFEKAAECLERYVDVMLGPAVLPKQTLFSPGLEMKESQSASSKELRQMLLKGLEEEPEYQQIMKYPKGAEAVRKLRLSLQDSAGYEVSKDS